jgi:RND family efflux transporter MFP subunit
MTPPLSHVTATAAHHHHLSAHAPVALRRLGWISLAVLLLLGAGAAVRVHGNIRQSEALAGQTVATATRSVLTVRPRAGATRSVTLPASLRGQQEAAVYARTSGYLKRWTCDIGDRVRAGDLLAVIEAPEADQELRQARAARDQVSARVALAQSSQARFESLAERDAVSRQELEERRATRTQAEADLAAAAANVRRLEALEQLRRVTAPISGVVVRRNTDIGALVTGSSSGKPLFELADIETLQIDLAVPQSHAAGLQAGQSVKVRWPDRPSQVAEARITRVAPGLDAATRSRQVVLDLPNPAHRWLPGAYVDVQITPPETVRAAASGSGAGDSAVLVVPTTVLQFRQDGPRVALVREGHVDWRTVRLGRDLGREVEVHSGLQPRDEIILNPADTLMAGEAVLVSAMPTARSAPASAPARTD